MRTPLIVGNWKMHGSVDDAVALAADVRRRVASVRGIEVAVAPAFPALHPVARRLEDSAVRLSAQNLHWEAQGAFTGEVSAPMLRAVGCTFVIVGHSERRQQFGETDEAVARKVRAALDHRLSPIACVGETLSQREARETFPVIDRQLDAAVSGLDSAEASRFVLAYEPVWAIGTGRNATAIQAEEVHAHLRQRLADRWGESAAAVRILYGGSVRPDVIDDLMAQPDVDGALVGGASLAAESFERIVKFQRGA